MANELANVQVNGTIDMLTMGKIMAESGMFADTRQAAQAIVKIQAGRELSIAPVAAMTGINIIKGKVALSANLMAARVKGFGYNYRIREHTEDACELEFFEKGESVGKSRFSIEDAKKAGLMGDNWRKFARNMLFARAMSNGAKWYCPDAFGGAPVYTAEELGESVDGETGEVVQVTATVEPTKTSKTAAMKAKLALPEAKPAEAGPIDPHWVRPHWVRCMEAFAKRGADDATAEKLIAATLKTLAVNKPG